MLLYCRLKKTLSTVTLCVIRTRENGTQISLASVAMSLKCIDNGSFGDSSGESMDESRLYGGLLDSEHDVQQRMWL
jgi:hypothetical protein